MSVSCIRRTAYVAKAHDYDRKWKHNAFHPYLAECPEGDVVQAQIIQDPPSTRVCTDVELDEIAGVGAGARGRGKGRGRAAPRGGRGRGRGAAIDDMSSLSSFVGSSDSD